MTTGQTQRSLYFIFALSGFSGLLYESVWSHYLKLFLGHAAYAQALVLIIFMGGMALGAWLVSRNSHYFRNLLLGYALIEAIIGVFGLVFHPLFQFVLDISFDSIIPALGTPLSVQIYKFSVASLLILPQSVLLGATFPLMSGGFIRKYPDTPGKTISVLYFANSIGAALALLVSAFYLIGKFGLPGTIFTAGLLNIALAIAVYGLVKGPGLLNLDAARTTSKPGHWPWVFLAASFFTGMASFIYEVAWIRMLSMVLGSSTHSFELMLSAFITGLAIGGYWIRKHIDKLQDPVGFAGIIQVIMGLLAFSTIFLYGYSFEIMSFFMAALDQTNQGYILFSIVSHAIALLIMLPATICAGMTLPLFTFILYKKGHGEKSIGQIYSSNTIGAIFGVIFTVYIGMPMLGLKGAILSGALIDIAIGITLIKMFSSTIISKQSANIIITCCLVIGVATTFFFDFNTKRMASSVFRYGTSELDAKSDIVFHQDGKTASVTVSNWDNKQVSIMTNGKSDASITMAPNLPPTSDESTMTLLAAFPLSVRPDAKTVANIGFGSGLTTHAALVWPDITRIDTIEIEEAMLEGARYFLPKTEKAFNDPRSYIHIDDARTFFSTYQKKYDIIISEPSNPWVSGVSSLFTLEFYDIVKTSLNEDGIFVQWIHIYEFNLELLASILKAITAKFDYYSIYFADDGNLILLASPDSPINYPDPSIFENRDIKELLSVIHIHNIDDLQFRFLGDQDIYDPYLLTFSVPENSDYHPVIDLNATKARFLGENVSDILDVRLTSVPIIDILYSGLVHRNNNLSPTEYFPFENARNAYKLYQFFSNRIFDKNIIESIASLNFLLAAAADCPQGYNQTVWGESLHLLQRQISGYLTSDQLADLSDAISPKCEEVQLPEFISNWMTFFIAVNERNIDHLIYAAKRLLATGENLNIEQKKYISTALLTGLIKAGEYEQAVFLWKEYMLQLFSMNNNIPQEIRLLLAIIGQDWIN